MLFWPGFFATSEELAEVTPGSTQAPLANAADSMSQAPLQDLHTPETPSVTAPSADPIPESDPGLPTVVASPPLEATPVGDADMLDVGVADGEDDPNRATATAPRSSTAIPFSALPTAPAEEKEGIDKDAIDHKVQQSENTTTPAPAVGLPSLPSTTLMNEVKSSEMDMTGVDIQHSYDTTTKSPP
jgi:hypothetical protein